VDVMRVERSSSETSLRCRRQERVLCMEVTVRESDEGGNEEVAASAAAAAPEAGGECRGVASAGTTKSSKMSRKEGEGLYTLTRHNNSPVLEHDFCPYAKSLNRTVSEARAMSMQQLGLLAREQKDFTNDDAFAAASEAFTAGSAAEPWQKKKLGEDYVAPSIRTGQVDRFVYKTYSSLCDRRTSSLPVGKGHAAARKMCIGEYWDVEGHNKMGTTASSSKSVSMSTTQENDFDMEAERRSKSVLLFQSAHTVLTIAIALLTVYLCICFLTSSVPRLNTATTITRTRSSIGGGFSHAKFLAMASSPLLGLVSAGLAILTGMWMSDAGVLWRHSDNVVASFCTHCADVGEESRNRVEQADEQVLQTHQAKQQFMAYVFHNIRVPFNAIVLGLGHMRATGDGVGALGLADKMDLVQMMLDCAETMTSVLDNVTDMGQWESGQMELHREEFDILTVVRFLSWGLKDLLEQKQIAFNMNIDDMTSKLLASHHVVGDKQRIVQTLGNFLSNAIKFTPSGGKLDLDLQCEEVTESVELDTLCKSSLPPSYPAPADPAEDSLLGAAGSSILAKTAPQRIFTDGKVARIRFSVKDDGIGKFSPVLYPLRGCCLGRKA
jgi:signal transduction histidine kinase